MLVEQVYVFLWSIVVGVILAILFDLFRALRFKGIKDIWVYIQDIIFWIVAAVVIIASTFIINEGELRGYMLIGYLLGAGFYVLLFSKFVLHILRFVFDGIRNGFVFAAKKIKNVFKFAKREKKVEARQEI